MRNPTKSVPSNSKATTVSGPAIPAASVDDTAAYLRVAPLLVEVLTVEVPPKVPARGATFAQQDLRKLDAELGPETDRALRQLVQLGADRLALDLGPAAARLRGLPELAQRRAQSTAVLARVRALLDYVETQQRVFDHDAVLVLETVGSAVSYLGQFDAAMRDRYSATLGVLGSRSAKIAEGLAQARASASQPTR